MNDVDTTTADFDALREQIAQLRDELRTNVGFEQGAWGVDGYTWRCRDRFRSAATSR